MFVYRSLISSKPRILLNCPIAVRVAIHSITVKIPLKFCVGKRKITKREIQRWPQSIQNVETGR